MRQIFLMLFLASGFICDAADGMGGQRDSTGTDGRQFAGEEPFEPNVESLKQYRCPEWFRDAKFGIYAHWNAQSVPAADGWYARNMYVQGHRAYKYHVQNYGHPSEFGYKDVIPLWKGEKFDPESLVQLYKKAGAKYIVCMAVHHDNFDLWDSKHHKWNSVNMGPKKDIVGLLRQATLKHGLRFGVTTHLARSYSWFNTSKGADKTGPLKGVPYDGNDPAYADFYFPKHDDSNIMHPLNPPAEVRENWLLRMKDLVDRYEPDHFYLDGGIPFRGDDEFRTGMALMSHYYNASIARHGRLDAVFCIKDNDRRYGELSHGLYVDGVATLDIERGRADRIRAEPWQTDTSIGDWFYRRGDRYRSAGDVIHELADIVSKNGNLLLNVPPRADGSLDRETVSILKGIGQWMTVNREAIYATRPWQRFGEDDVRFTTKDDALYAVSLKWPERELLIKCLGTDAAGKAVRSVDLLGHDTTLVFQQDAAGLRITLPVKKPCAHAYSFRIEFSAH